MADAPAKDSIGQGIYSGVAIFGRFGAVLALIIATVIALVLIVIGVAAMRAPRRMRVFASVESVDSCGTQDGQFTCPAYVLYSVDGKQYNARVIVRGPSPIGVGDRIPLWYDPAKPSDVLANQTIGGVPLIIGGTVLFAIALTSAVLAFRSRGYAATIGAIGAARAIF